MIPLLAGALVILCKPSWWQVTLLLYTIAFIENPPTRQATPDRIQKYDHHAELTRLARRTREEEIRDNPGWEPSRK